MGNTKEEFRDIKGYEGLYQVSNLGRVKSLSRLINHWRGGERLIKERIKSVAVGSDGYLMVGLSKEGNPESITIHKLVAVAFLNHTPCGFKIVVDHIDNDPLNNNANNLQLVTNRENTSKDRKGASKYVGVTRLKRNNKWKASIWLNGRTEYLGAFKEEYTASIAYQTALHNHLNK